MNSKSAGRSRGEIRHRLAELISEIGKIPLAQIVDGATLDEHLRMESVALIELQVAIEDRYDIEIDPIHVVELNEFSVIVEYVHEQVAASVR